MDILVKNETTVFPRDVAIEVSHLNKTFKIPHEKHTSLKSAAVNILKPTSYEIFKALSDVSFRVEKGEFFGIVGSNGSGKSTLLKVLAGIYVPDKGSGSVKIHGKFSPFLELGVGFNQELTGRENVFLGGAVLGLTKKEIKEKYDRIVGFAELEEFIDMKFKNYSSGMQVRLAFALAINARAEILLMDEVLAVGDTNFQNKCLDEFARYKEEGKTVILVSHDIPTIKKYCDRVLWLEKGIVEELGETSGTTDNYLKKSFVEMAKVRNEPGETPQILGVEFFNGKKKCDKFEPGSNLIVKVDYVNPSLRKDLHFGVSIFDRGGAYIFGTDTFIDKVLIPSHSETDRFEIAFKKLPLRSGLYYIKAGIWGDTQGVQYDFFDSTNFFSVTSKNKNQGLIEIDYEWL